jgi:hypothetical protein
MLSNGIKVNFEVTKGDARAEVMVGALGCVVVVGVDLKRWKIEHKKKPYSVMFCVGPLIIKVVSLEKMNEFIDNVLKENEDSFHSET